MACSQGNAPDQLCGNLWVRPILLRGVGAEVPEHQHTFPHAMIGCGGTGEVVLRYDDGRPTATHALTTGAAVWVPAEAWHRLISRSEVCEAVCVFPARDSDGVIRDDGTATTKYPSGHDLATV